MQTLHVELRKVLDDRNHSWVAHDIHIRFDLPKSGFDFPRVFGGELHEGLENQNDRIFAGEGGEVDFKQLRRVFPFLPLEDCVKHKIIVTHTVYCKAGLVADSSRSSAHEASGRSAHQLRNF